MDDDIRAFGDALGRKALARDWVGVHQLLPWLRASLGPEHVRSGGNVRPVPAEVTDENWRFWMKLQLQASDAQMAELNFDTFCEVWIAIVTTGEGLRVGYWSHGAY
jgi:hypothetical protein